MFGQQLADHAVGTDEIRSNVVALPPPREMLRKPYI